MISVLPAPLALLFVVLAWAGEAFGETPEPIPSSASVPAQRFELLFLGNSHSAANDLPGLVTGLITAGQPGAQATAELAPGYRYLADRINDGETNALLNSRPWTHVILQAQKYSSSGLYFYPTDAAEEWIRRIRARQAEPILFPEWPRRGNSEEGQRVHDLHLSIAAREPACVAPVGLAWETSLAREPQLSLHAPDGNHSNPTGALLTAFVLYEVITGSPASALPDVPAIAIDGETQRKLREVASEVIAVNLETCPQLTVGPGDDPVMIGDTPIPIPSLDARGAGLLILGCMVIGMVGLSRP